MIHSQICLVWHYIFIRHTRAHTCCWDLYWDHRMMSNTRAIGSYLTINQIVIELDKKLGTNLQASIHGKDKQIVVYTSWTPHISLDLNCFPSNIMFLSLNYYDSTLADTQEPARDKKVEIKVYKFHIMFWHETLTWWWWWLTDY